LRDLEGFFYTVLLCHFHRSAKSNLMPKQEGRRAASADLVPTYSARVKDTLILQSVS
jgi:hypothetical protein